MPALLDRPATTRLQERHTVGGVDREAGVIYRVKILGRESKNGRVYMRTAMADAARLYNNIAVNIDHPDRATPHADRSVRDRFGVLRNVTVEADSVFGDLHFNRQHQMAGYVTEAAERFPNTLGLSHNCEGRGRWCDGTYYIDNIISVESVDLVADAASVTGLFEQKEQVMNESYTRARSGSEFADRYAGDGPRSWSQNFATTRFKQHPVLQETDFERRRRLAENLHTGVIVPVETPTDAATPDDVVDILLAEILDELDRIGCVVAAGSLKRFQSSVSVAKDKLAELASPRKKDGSENAVSESRGMLDGPVDYTPRPSSRGTPGDGYVPAANGKEFANRYL